MAAFRAARASGATALLVVCVLAGCAPARTGKAAKPSPVIVTYNYEDPVAAPCVIALKEAFAQELTIEAPGFRPLQVRLRETSGGWTWRNVAFGRRALIGLDLAYGEVYLLTDEECVRAHPGADAVEDLQPDHVYVVVAPREQGWRRIGRLPPPEPD